MRTLKELLQILLHEVERNGVGKSGLCYLIFIINHDLRKISDNEYSLLDEWLIEKMDDNLWLFPKGETAPRIEFLKKEIEKL